MPIYVSGIVCQELIQEKESELFSAIRIADVLNIEVPEARPGTNLLVNPATPNLLAMFRSEGPEKFQATIRIVDPEGKIAGSRTDGIELQGGVRGHASRAGLILNPLQNGTWWFEILVGDNPVPQLRIPFLITHTQSHTAESENPPQA